MISVNEVGVGVPFGVCVVGWEGEKFGRKAVVFVENHWKWICFVHSLSLSPRVKSRPSSYSRVELEL